MQVPRQLSSIFAAGLQTAVGFGHTICMVDTPKRKRRWLQYRLRTLLALMLLASISMGWVTVRMRAAYRQQETVLAIREAGGEAYYIEGRPKAVWLQALMGKARVFQVTFSDAANKTIDLEMQHVAQLTNLQHLLLDGTQITDEGLQHIEGLTELEVLYLARTQITDAGLEHIHDLPRLRFVDLRDTRVTGSGFRHFRGLSNLQELSLDGTDVTDAALPYLTALPQLQYLSLNNTQVTDAGLSYLNNLTTLKTVRLSGTKITDAGLQHLDVASQLETLEADNTNVTAEGLRSFRRALLNRSVHDGF
jgi:hypothetical protein